METAPGDGMARVLAVASVLPPLVCSDSLFSLESLSSARDKKYKPGEIYWPPVLALLLMFSKRTKRKIKQRLRTGYTAIEENKKTLWTRL